MNKILFFDTETSGMPDWKQPSESPHQPHMVDIAAQLYTEAGELIDQFETLIKPDGWVIPQECIDIHGISNEMAAEQGIDEAAALAGFLALHDQAQLRVGHNRMFDDRIVRIAIKRFAGETEEARDAVAEAFKAAPADCTMWLTKDILRLPATPAMVRTGKGKWFKQPKLTESYAHFFGAPFQGAHRAMVDTRATARLYFKVKHDLDIGA